MGWLCSNHNIELYEIRHAYSVLSISLIGFCIFPSIHVLYDLCSHVCMLVFFFFGGGGSSIHAGVYPIKIPFCPKSFTTTSD